MIKKTKILLFALMICYSTSALSQIPKNDSLYHNDNGEKIYYKKQDVDNVASFPKGDEALYKFLSNKLRYPPNARENSFQGKVITSFVVEKDGSISDVKILSGKYDDLNKETLRIIKLFPKWEPAIKDGLPVRFQIIFPCSFTLK